VGSTSIDESFKRWLHNSARIKISDIRDDHQIKGIRDLQTAADALASPAQRLVEKFAHKFQAAKESFRGTRAGYAGSLTFETVMSSGIAVKVETYIDL
jgi:hypothetical protein